MRGSVYLVQPVKFLKTNIYKIGRTDGKLQRLSAYGKDADIIYFLQVSNPSKIESLLKNKFDKYFMNERKLGREYYSGSSIQMRKVFIDNVTTYEIGKGLNTIEISNEMTEEITIDTESCTCPKCHRSFRDKHALKQHIKNQVKDCSTRDPYNNKNSKCPKCQKEFANKYGAKQHLEKDRCRSKNDP